MSHPSYLGCALLLSLLGGVAPAQDYSAPNYSAPESTSPAYSGTQYSPTSPGAAPAQAPEAFGTPYSRTGYSATPHSPSESPPESPTAATRPNTEHPDTEPGGLPPAGLPPSELPTGRPAGMPIRLVQRAAVPSAAVPSAAVPSTSEPSVSEPSVSEPGHDSGEKMPSGGEAASATTVDPLPLDPPAKDAARGRTSRRGGSSVGSVITVVGSLAVVLGAFFVVVWLSRRALPKANLGLPAEAVEILGQTPLQGRQVAQLVRVGNKILLVAVSAHHVQTLTEITDPAEVDRLAAVCRRSPSDSVTFAFRQVLGQFGGDQGPAGAARLGRTEHSSGHRRRPAIEV